MGRRRDASSFDNFLVEWRVSARAAANALSTTDGRWALVSTSLTAVLAGAIAWLAAGTIPPSTSRYEASREQSLLPYQLFLRLAAHGKANYASIGPSGSITGSPADAAYDPNALDNSLADERAGTDNRPSIDSRTVTMDSGDTLVGALTQSGVSAEDASAAVVALAKVYNTRSLRAGQSFEVTFKPAEGPAVQITYTPPHSASAANDSDGSAPEPVGQLLSISFSPTVDHDVSIARTTDGSFVAQDAQKKLEAHYHHAGATIDSSLYLAAMQAGIPADVVVDMIHMFSYEVDFQRDIRPGDSFEVLYDYYYTPDGQPAKQGEISYAVMKLAGRTVALYRYQPNPNEPADFFNAKGQSAKSMLMKTPVDGARISSGFGMRFHPVLGYSRMHKGIDFAVPVGTPVMAAGTGTVVMAGLSNGYGNYVRINMGNGYQTAYGHLSRYAPGIHKGSHVHQGQIIAYSGNTGLSTGPHLHYEILVNNEQVNPLKVKVATGRKLGGKDLRDFLQQRTHVDTKIAAMPLETKLAEGTSELRAAKD
ncbi:MAG: peptidoglycan DD-metalloendopeptidase family protein [Proteobacteria bacterium]|nr:peptidoglycan DD-metalloendopeptidase family protein [Pseudomonadota bacterium]